MIEINLAPAGRKAGKRSSGVGDPGSIRWFRAAAGVAVALILLGSILFGGQRLSAREGAVERAIQLELADSIEHVAAITRIQALRDSEATIAGKIRFIRSADHRRFHWPRLLEEIAHALPERTWLRSIETTASADSIRGPSFAVHGTTGSAAALTRFMKALGDLPVVSDVMLVGMEQDPSERETLQRFTLEVRHAAWDLPVIRVSSMPAANR